MKVHQKIVYEKNSRKNGLGNIQYLLQYVPLCSVAPNVGNKKERGEKIYIPIVFCVWPVQEAALRGHHRR